MSTAVAISRTRDQSSHSFCCLKMNLQIKEMVRRMGGMGWGGGGGFEEVRLDVGSYSLIEVVEIIEDDDGNVEPHKSEEEDAEEEEKPAAVTLKARERTSMHTSAWHTQTIARC